MAMNAASIKGLSTLLGSFVLAIDASAFHVNRVGLCIALAKCLNISSLF